jgi:hypothetical protein
LPFNVKTSRFAVIRPYGVCDVSRIRWDEDLRGHPDRAETERALFAGFVSVRERYEITPDGVIIGAGGISRWYAPIAHPELPQFVAKLAEADEPAALAFAENYGTLGFTSLTRDIDKAFYTWPNGEKTMGGDPIEWIRSHGKTVSLCLELTEAIQKNSVGDIDRLTERRRLKDDRPTFAIFHLAELGDAREYHLHLNPPAFERARKVRADLINPNIARIHRHLTVDEKGNDRSFFACGSVLEAVYWHLANLAEGGVVRRCVRPSCGALFIQKHRSQEYCAPRWGRGESPCAVWVRQRRLTDPHLQRITTKGQRGGKKAHKVPASRSKKLTVS